MAKKLFGRDLANTAFSGERLIIWGLMINLLILVAGIIWLVNQDKDIMPLGTLAGTIVGYFIGKKGKP